MRQVFLATVKSTGKNFTMNIFSRLSSTPGFVVSKFPSGRGDQATQCELISKANESKNLIWIASSTSFYDLRRIFRCSRPWPKLPVFIFLILHFLDLDFAEFLHFPFSWSSILDWTVFLSGESNMGIVIYDTSAKWRFFRRVAIGHTRRSRVGPMTRDEKLPFARVSYTTFCDVAWK